jgi:hypothetical protein
VHAAVVGEALSDLNAERAVDDHLDREHAVERTRELDRHATGTQVGEIAATAPHERKKGPQPNRETRPTDALHSASRNP